jgi:predicted transcriptional regulator YheO
MSYQMIAQWELLHKNHKFATHIPNFFFDIIKVLIHSITSSSWVHIHNGKLLGHQLQARDVINKPNLDVILHSNLEYMDLSRLCTSLGYLS